MSRAGTKVSRAVMRIFLAATLVAHLSFVPEAEAYVLNRTIAASGGCPQPNAQLATSNGVDRRWNTTLGVNILTTAAGAAQRMDEVEAVIQESFAVWTNAGTGLKPASLATLNRIPVPTTNDCNFSDGLNTLCFAQSASFSSGVLAFTTVASSDSLSDIVGTKQSQFIGQILDSDVLFNPAESFATPTALPTNQNAYDLESVLVHELGHFFGFSHSGVLRAIMYPFAPPRGQFAGDRPTVQSPDAPLAEDDRA
ncbi:MAG TPA: matrixin family metalloprotease, partial [Candidatus Nitrosotenuis sp.]|nr:matrixin family metalloprotease [Candidatus Nitrosotenuis sp.]